MTLLVPIVMFGWIPVVLLVFLLLPPRTAVAVSFIGAWLFLPVVSYEISGLPDYTKMSASCVGILLATLLFHGDRFRGLRFHWLDLPIMTWCLVPFASSISNGLGAYDGLSCVLTTTVTWGFPYLIGRLHFQDAAGLRFLARALLVGGLVYVPLCLFEIKMSPQLNEAVYGFRTERFWNTVRFGGFRPEVFMGSGLMVGMWMSATALVGVWLWLTGAVTHVRGYRAGWPVAILLATAVLCKSLGALALLAIGLGVLLGTRKLGKPILVIALAAFPVLYVTTRGMGLWSGSMLLNAAGAISEERADSLWVRLVNEDMLVARARERLMLGWGGYGRNRVYDPDTGADLTITDGLWVIVLGSNGLIGLTALMSTWILPAVLLLRRVPAARWSDPAYAGAAALAVSVLLYACDNLFNAMLNPVYMLCSGGLVAFCSGFRRAPATMTSSLRTDAVLAA